MKKIVLVTVLSTVFLVSGMLERSNGFSELPTPRTFLFEMTDCVVAVLGHSVQVFDHISRSPLGIGSYLAIAMSQYSDAMRLLSDGTATLQSLSAFESEIKPTVEAALLRVQDETNCDVQKRVFLAHLLRHVLYHSGDESRKFDLLFQLVPERYQIEQTVLSGQQ